jgi:hypothetical protein
VTTEKAPVDNTPPLPAVPSLKNIEPSHHISLRPSKACNRQHNPQSHPHAGRSMHRKPPRSPMRNCGRGHDVQEQYFTLTDAESSLESQMKVWGHREDLKLTAYPWRPSPSFTRLSSATAVRSFTAPLYYLSSVALDKIEPKSCSKYRHCSSSCIRNSSTWSLYHTKSVLGVRNKTRSYRTA